MKQFRLTHALLVATVFALVPAASGDTLTYSDNFEASTLNSFWAVNQQLGTVSLSTNQNHTPSGSQSVEFAPSSTSGQHDMSLTHTFSTETQGDYTVWFYDSGEAYSDQTYYNFLALVDSATGDIASVGNMDFDPSCYAAGLYTPSASFGPNASCGPYPQLTTTDTARTVGWHEFEIDDSATSLIISIDGTQVLDVAGNYSFDSVTLHTFGPENSTTPTYWDDFNAVTTSAVPEPSSVVPLTIFLGSIILRRKTWGIGNPSR